MCHSCGGGKRLGDVATCWIAGRRGSCCLHSERTYPRGSLVEHRLVEFKVSGDDEFAGNGNGRGEFVYVLLVRRDGIRSDADKIVQRLLGGLAPRTAPICDRSPAVKYSARAENDHF